MSNFFFNDRTALVNDAIEGALVTAPHKNLAKLDTDPSMRVVVRKDWDKKKVAVVSGGGAGHEPAHLGFVGKGMLTAAVCGDLFASPSVDAVLTAIIAVTGEAGCLLIIKNYTGDRLNFGLAAEKAKHLGYKVEMVIVRDDISLPDNKQPRGIAGTVFIHKMAGYAAEAGYSLAEVKEFVDHANKQVFSIGAAMSGCHLPQAQSDAQRIPEGSIELGLGIHGEPGASTVATQNSREVIELMLSKLTPHVTGKDRVAVMVNNLGGVSALEMGILTKELYHSAIASKISWIVGPALIVTALDMKGLSLTLLALDEKIEKALTAPTEAPAWIKAVQPEKMSVISLEAVETKVQYTPSDDKVSGKIVDVVTQTLSELEDELNALDAKVGDGDTGATFAAGARGIAALLKAQDLPLADQSKLCLVIGERLAVVMGGSSGVLMSIFFTGTGQKLAEGQSLVDGLLFGLKQMKHYGGADLGDRTMIDALQPALEALKQSNSLDDAAKAANNGAEGTAKSTKANAGRSSYLNSDSLAGNPDPGAVAVAKVFAALLKAGIV
ncbi:dihydroxyacetone kinase subunit DhaK [Commensalibacter papalotli (ex Servin-Garciduenas et al. 2014)]|uniref:Dihydroxyacetone kinase n=1 Tax=Commensalibacter papalotli (ex Servin-Garciduenas et al. 2014) TaxID=1208583 RepID=W7E7D4_9PROT|nr:dihydroxyacetone kinase subunit DhaK [Commensalibacter papalotli (ex Servin-Garciduenas et al. 2014)]EUK19081.1 dihydroxyacetone kinase [Commensalibacter papalotli (ex Servin-Garciduenas et al. 2014)]